MNARTWFDRAAAIADIGREGLLIRHGPVGLVGLIPGDAVAVTGVLPGRLVCHRLQEIAIDTELTVATNPSTGSR